MKLAREWLKEALNGTRRVGIPCTSLTAFTRIATNPRALRDPFTPVDAWAMVEAWLDVPVVWSPAPGRGHRAILGRLIRELDLRGPIISDAVLAALCIEHGLAVVSADTDFARFTEIRWINPVRV